MKRKIRIRKQYRPTTSSYVSISIEEESRTKVFIHSLRKGYRDRNGRGFPMPKIYVLHVIEKRMQCRKVRPFLKYHSVDIMCQIHDHGFYTICSGKNCTLASSINHVIAFLPIFGPSPPPPL